MKRLALFSLTILLFLGCFGHSFKLTNDEIVWEKSFKGIPNKTAIINTVITDSTIIGQLNNYSVNYEAQGIEWRYLPIMLNDPLNAEVCIKITSDSTYTVTVSDVVFKITDINRGPIGQLADLEYYMLGFKGKKFKADPMLDEVRNILSRDFIRIFSPTN